jgi:hypothetical protein
MFNDKRIIMRTIENYQHKNLEAKPDSNSALKMLHYTNPNSNTNAYSNNG